MCVVRRHSRRQISPAPGVFSREGASATASNKPPAFGTPEAPEPIQGVHIGSWVTTREAGDKEIYRPPAPLFMGWQNSGLEGTLLGERWRLVRQDYDRSLVIGKSGGRKKLGEGDKLTTKSGIALALLDVEKDAFGNESAKVAIEINGTSQRVDVAERSTVDLSIEGKRVCICNLGVEPSEKRAILEVVEGIKVLRNGGIHVDDAGQRWQVQIASGTELTYCWALKKVA